MSDLITAEHRALTGDRVRIETEQQFSPVSYTSSATVVLGNRRMRFTGSPRRDLGDLAATNVAGLVLDQEYDVLGQSIRTGHAFRQDLGEAHAMTLWTGSKSCIFGFLAGERITVESALDVCSALSFDEVEGVPRLVNKEPSVWFEDRTFASRLPDLGVVQTTPRTSEALAQLPPWQGTDVRGGELFSDQQADGRSVFVLVGPAAHTTIVPAANSENDTVLRFLASVEVTWSVA
jgi:hypothetical protein